MVEKIGDISLEIINTLNLNIPAGTAVYISKSNHRHMNNRHPWEYAKYHNRLPEIVSNPDYVGINSSDGSLEFIKVFSKYIKIAVRIANDGEYYIRSMYEVGKSRVENSVKTGQLKLLTKP